MMLNSMLPRLAAVVLMFAGTAIASTDIEFVLDVSGSMKQLLRGETQIDAARKALSSALDEIHPGQLVAVRVYGHRAEQADKEASCKDTELILPFKELNKAEILAKASALTPKGWTPIAYSLEQTRNDLLDVGMAREAERVIILLTDGEETCGGDPVAVLKKLKDEGFKLRVYTVGFNVNDVARKQLQAIADFSGGRYFDAKDGVELNNALREATKTAAVVEKKGVTYGDTIRGGDSYEQAVPIELNKEYRLDHHQKKHEYDYFYFDGRLGDAITVFLSTTDKGIHIPPDQGPPRETVNPYAGLQVHGSSRNKLFDLKIIGDPFKNVSKEFSLPSDGRYYLLVGSDYEAMSSQHATFKVTAVKRGDLGTEQDAGDSLEKALRIEAKRYSGNFIGIADKLDMFVFHAAAGDSYVAGVIPDARNTSYFTIAVLDEFRQVVSRDSSQSGAGLKTREFTVAEEGDYFLELTYDAPEPVPYTLVLKKKEKTESGAAPAQ